MIHKDIQRLLLVFPLLIACILVRAQPNELKTLPTEIFKKVRKDTKDTVNWKWKYGGNTNLNIGHTALNNWAAGGEKFTLNVTAFQNIFLYYRQGKRSWDNNLDANIGYIQTASKGGQKNDDRLNFTSKYGWQADSSKKVFMSLLYDLRTQIFDGRKYFKKDSSEITSTTFSPSYQLFSLGIDYKPVKDLSIFISPITSRFTIIGSRDIAAKGLYLPAGKWFKASPGAFASINYQKNNLFNNVNIKTRMDLFSDYTNRPENIDLVMNHVITFKINRFLTATYTVDMIYDDDIRAFGPDGKSPALQIKSLLGIGFSFPYKNGYVRQKS